MTTEDQTNFTKRTKRVIDEDFIIQCINDTQRQIFEAEQEENTDTLLNNSNNKIEKFVENKEIDFDTLTQLQLSYRDIYKIDHLKGFSSLIKLELDNNIIETIENIDHLINLEWLDLSFNNIKKICGLDKLTKLKDLCLVNNFISKIEGLDNNKNLQILSLGNNNITDMNDILYLKKLKNLQAINLLGNPISKKEEYKTNIYAYCNNLKYLDYNKISETDIKLAKDMKQSELLEIDEKEKIDNEIESKKQIENQFNIKLKNANIFEISTLYQDMFKDDTETLLKLKHLPGIQILLNEYKLKLNNLIEKYINDVLIVYNNKINEDNILRNTINKYINDSNDKSILIIKLFEKNEYEIWLNNNNKFDRNELILILVNISNKLMKYEMNCVENIKFILNIYDDKCNDLMKKNLNNCEIFFEEVQCYENEYYDKLIELINEYKNKIKLNGLDNVIPYNGENDVLRNIIMDNDTINNCAQLSHDNHLSHIGRMEDLVREREEKENKNKIEKQNTEEYNRNRQKISEILIFLEKYCKEFGLFINEIQEYSPKSGDGDSKEDE